MKWQKTVVAAIGVALTMGTVHAQAPRDTKTKTSGEQIVFHTQPDPPKAGENQFEVTVKDKSGKAVTDADVSVLLVMPAMPAMNMAEMRKTVTLASASPGTYRGKGDVPTAGRWNVTITVSEHGRVLSKKRLAIVAK